MKKEHLIQIAKVGFPQRVKDNIDFENAEMIRKSNSFWLYDKNTPFNFLLPKESHFAIHIEGKEFVQITSYRKAFNHYAAIKEMERLGLI